MQPKHIFNYNVYLNRDNFQIETTGICSIGVAKGVLSKQEL